MRLRRYRTLAQTAWVFGLVLATVSCGQDDTSKSRPEAFNVSGSVTVNLRYGSKLSPGDVCVTNRIGYLENGPSDIKVGTQVKVTSNDGVVLALGSLEAGVAGRAANQYGMGLPCAFAFHVDKVPAQKSNIYALVIGDRPPYSFSKADAGHLNLQIGS